MDKPQIDETELLALSGIVQAMKDPENNLDSIDYAQRRLTEKAFNRYPDVYRIVNRLYRDNNFVDAHHLAGGLESGRVDVGDDVSYQTFADDLFKDPQSEPATRKYIDDVVRAGNKRRQKEFVAKVGTIVEQGDGGEKILDQIDRERLQLRTGVAVDTHRSLGDDFKTLYTDALAPPTKGIVKFREPFTPLDEQTAAYRYGYLAVLAAAPKMGKSFLSTQLALAAVKNTYNAIAIVFSIEMPRRVQFNRIIAQQTNVNYAALAKGRLTSEEEDGMNTHQLAEDLSKVWIYDRQRLGLEVTPSMIKARIEYLKRKTGAERVFVIVDYLQRIRPDEKQPTAKEHQDAVTEGLKAVQELTQTYMLVIAQMSKKGIGDYQSTKGDDSLAVLGSVGTNYTYDLLMFLEASENKKDEEPRTLRIIENREGDTAGMDLLFKRKGNMEFVKAGSQPVSGTTHQRARLPGNKSNA